MTALSTHLEATRRDAKLLRESVRFQARLVRTRVDHIGHDSPVRDELRAIANRYDAALADLDAIIEGTLT